MRTRRACVGLPSVDHGGFAIRARIPTLVAVPLVALTLLAAPMTSTAAPARTPTSATAQSPAATAVAPPRLDLTGKWLLRHVVKRSERPAFRGLVLLFRVDLVQRGDRITGTAEKWRENGRPVPSGARSVLQIDGTVRGREITGRFVETRAGTSGRRRSHGSFRWRYSVQEGWLSGSFTTEVSSASGESTAIAIG